MAILRCPYCRELFEPSRYHPDQVVCSGHDCQRRRRGEYHRQKLQLDPTYREQCRDSQGKWRDCHPEYMKEYRRKHGRRPAKTPRPPKAPRALHRILERVKNNVAFDLTSCRATVWVISANERVKNILATAELIVIEVFALDYLLVPFGKEPLFGRNPRHVV